MFLNPTKRVLCPYCFSETRYRKEIQNCANPNCKQELPAEYVNRFEDAKPFFAQILGWSGVGKTVYLEALTLKLMRMSIFWPDLYSYTPLTSPTLKYVRDVRGFLDNGIMPESTQLDINEAYIMLLLGMERWGGRTLVMRDVAGEVFNDLPIMVKYTPYLLHVPTTLLMISLYDLKHQSRLSMDDLINSYIFTLQKHDPEFRKKQRNAVIVLSKADLILDRLPSNICEHLENDPFNDLDGLKGSGNLTNIGGMLGYMRDIAKISQEVRAWLDSDPIGHNLIQRARDNNIHLEFSIVSSTGRPIERGGKMQVSLQPTRVLDPMFWALEFQSRQA